MFSGTGTLNLGQWDMRLRRGVCTSCGRVETLRSYETSAVLFILFLPVLPLGRRRVLAQCPACGRSADTREAGSWRAERDRAVGTAAGELALDPTSADAAVRFVLATATYEDERRFLAAAPDLDHRFARHAGVQDALGAVYACFGRAAEAEAAYRRSLAVADVPAVRESLAVLLMQQGRPADAEPLLRHLTDARTSAAAERFEQLAEAYQAAGDHRRARAALDVAARNAGRADAPASVGAGAEHHRSVQPGQPVPARTVPYLGSGRRVRRPWGRVVPWLALVYLTAVLGGTYVLVCLAAGYTRGVYVVNGLRRPYTVLVNGERVVLAPLSATRVRVGQGPVTVEVAEGLHVAAPTLRDELRTPLLLRPMRSPTLVFNPDRAAILFDEEVEYGGYPFAFRSNPYTMYSGEGVYRFERIDYAFEPAPATIEGRSGDRRRRLAQVVDGTPADALELLRRERGEEAADRFAEHYLSGQGGGPPPTRPAPER
ncbi:MAG TPA: hypothetical protein VF796_10970 [Humisphaera sp.]